MGWLTTVRRTMTIVAAGVLAAAAPAQASDDDFVLTDFPGTYGSNAAGVAAQADGKIVAAGSTSTWDDAVGNYVSRFALARYNADLSLDTSFGDDGRLTTDVDADASETGAEVMIQADGKIVVAGSTDGGVALARYHEDGSLDSSFAGDGTVTSDLGAFDRAYGAALQPDGKIIVVGGAIAIARYRTDGSLDPSFGGDGVVTHDFGAQSFGGDVAIRPDGKIVVAGFSTVARFHADGSVDTAFGTGGAARSSINIVALALQPNGRIVVGGSSDGHFGLSRLHADGSLDTSFGEGGTQTTAFSNDHESGESVTGLTVQRNGKIVAVGIWWWSWFQGGIAGTYLPIARYDADGRLDMTSGSGGGPDQSAAAVAQKPDGQIVIAGQGNTWGDGYYGPQRFLLVRLAAETIATTITGGPSGTTDSTAPAFSFMTGVPGSTFECKLDGPGSATGSYASCTSAKLYTGLADGDYTFSVRATDPEGITGEPATRSFTVDTSPPESTITSGPNGPFGGSTGQFYFTSEPGATFECKLDGPGEAVGSFASCTPWKVYSGLADGHYTFSVRAKKGGLTETTPATQSFTVDTVPPAATITAGPSGTTSQTTPQFSFTAGGPISHYACWLSGPGQPNIFLLCTSPHTVGPLAPGSYTFTVHATDPAGNAGTASRSFTVAAAVLDTTITSGPPALTNGTSPSFTFTATPAGSTFECKLETPTGAGGYSACTSPRSYTTTTNGTYTFSVRAVGPGGTDATPATRSFTVDTVAPSTSLDSGPIGSTTDDTPRLEFSANEPSSFECRLDTVETPGSLEACTSPLDLGPLAGGVEYAVFIRATDLAGNVDASPAYSGLFVVDGSPPDTWIDDGPTGVTSVTAPSFTFHATLGGSTFECKLDRPEGPGSYAPCSSPKAYTTTTNGPYTLAVRATSNGRTDRSPATQSFTVATTPSPTPTPNPSPSPSPSPGCVATNGNDLPIPDLSTVESPITISGCAGAASATAAVEVHVVHTWIGDLVVTLIAPDGSAYPLHNRAGGSADNINQTYTVNLSSEQRNGTWKLRVQDAANADIGRIDSWTINL